MNSLATQTSYQESVGYAIAVLVDLAQRGEIDPWDVQVIEVVDRHLSKLALSASESGEQEANLPQSGQALLWASMLVLLKADTLQRLEEGEKEEELPTPELEETDQERRLPSKLENHIRRRPSAPPPRRRRVTLTELIEQIKEIAVLLEENETSGVHKERPRSHTRQEATRLVSQLAHNENLTEIASQLEEFLAIHWRDWQVSPEGINLEQLLHCWSETQLPPAEVSEHSSSSEKVGLFWALLLLSSQSKVELHQEEFYQDLKIRLL